MILTTWYSRFDASTLLNQAELARPTHASSRNRLQNVSRGKWRAQRNNDLTLTRISLRSTRAG